MFDTTEEYYMGLIAIAAQRDRNGSEANEQFA